MSDHNNPPYGGHDLSLGSEKQPRPLPPQRPLPNTGPPAQTQQHYGQTYLGGQQQYYPPAPQQQQQHWNSPEVSYYPHPQYYPSSPPTSQYTQPPPGQPSQFDTAANYYQQPPGSGIPLPLPPHPAEEYIYPPQSSVQQYYPPSTDTPQPIPGQSTFQYLAQLSTMADSSAYPVPSTVHTNYDSPDSGSSPPIASHRRPLPASVEDDPIDDMGSQFQNMSVNNGISDDGHAQFSTPGAYFTAETSSPSPTTQPKRKILPVPLPPIRRTGPCNEFLNDCPGDEYIFFSLNWYRLRRGPPDFLICSHCYADNILGSRFESGFECFKQQEGIPSLCRFWKPRVKDDLWPAALVNGGNLSSLQAYASKRVNILDCQGQKGVAGPTAADVKWFNFKKDEIANFVCCEGCYEDEICAAGLENRFEISAVAQQPEDTWVCDLTVEYISKVIQAFGTRGQRRSDGWTACIAAISQRMQLPDCRGQAVSTESVKWYIPRRNFSDFAICETCYLDKLALTEFEHEFTMAWAEPSAQSNPPAQPGTDIARQMTLQEHKPEQFICDLFGLPMVFALSAAKTSHNFSVWWKAAKTMHDYQPCTSQETQGEVTWYTLAGDAVNFDICPACYSGIVEPWGLTPFFQARSSVVDDNGTLRSVVCDFNIAQPRVMKLVVLLTRVLFTGVFEPLETYIRKHADIPACMKKRFLINAVWYGFPDARFCTDCYEDVVEGSSLDSALVLRGVKDADKNMCCLYSPRMRQKWAEACAVGSADDFVAFARHRWVVYHNTVAVVEAMEAARLAKLAAASMKALTASQYHGMSLQAETYGLGDGQHYSYGGREYDNWEGAYSAKLTNQSSIEYRNANADDSIMMKFQLFKQWADVE
ncbi:hypothetical protein BX600DRAFT_499611 [Xylariales sp. PMI_506]|nr:hypothetical protein BX600DRAFT_499611 [Xylariales sp. PMI_506]